MLVKAGEIHIDPLRVCVYIYAYIYTEELFKTSRGNIAVLYIHSYSYTYTHTLPELSRGDSAAAGGLFACMDAVCEQMSNEGDIHMYAYAHTYTCMHMHTYICMHMHTCSLRNKCHYHALCMHVFVNIICTCICIYIHSHS
jgi:hypothetical protein